MSDVRFGSSDAVRAAPSQRVREQVEQVTAPRRDGVTIRAIAERVFGDRRRRAGSSGCYDRRTKPTKLKPRPRSRSRRSWPNFEDENAVFSALAERDARNVSVGEATVMPFARLSRHG